MDISKWLEETEQPQFAPDSPRRKHPRRRARSDSSFVEPLSPKPPSCQQEVREESASEAYPAPPSDCSKSSRYARKPRRKTRPERYEPNVHQHRGRKTSPKKARHKSTRKKNERPGVVVQSFRAKNVSGDRLTLKPPELGLFNKGRASMAVRGRGLPDLVFSEMKFLQQHNHSPKPPPQPDVAEKKRKKDHIQTREGEISAFFTCERLAPTVQAEKRPSCQDSRQETKRRHRDQGSMTDVVVPTVELVDRDAFVAFGNRRPRHDSTSYVSWSESIRAPSTTPARLQADYDNMSVRHDSDRHKQYKSKIDGEEGSPKQPVLLSAVKQSTGGVAERFKVSSQVPSRSDVSRSHSCPQYSSSPRRAIPVNQAEKPQSADAACLPSSTSPASPAHVTVDADPRLSANRSNTTKHGISPNFNKKAHPYKRHQIVDDDYNGWEESLEPSSDLGKVLQECKDTFQEQYRATLSQTRHAVRPEPLLPSPSVRRQDRTISHPSTRRMPSVRFAEQPCQYQILPSIAGPSIYEQQEQRRYPCLELYEGEDVGVDPGALEQEYMVEYGGLYYDDDDGWHGMVDEPMAHGLEDDKEMYLAGSAFAADDVSEDSRRGNGVVAPGFWRPNKLY